MDVISFFFNALLILHYKYDISSCSDIFYSLTATKYVQIGKLQVAGQYQLVEIRHIVPLLSRRLMKLLLSVGVSQQWSDVH